MTNCDIVRDLLPVYVEGLSSEATNGLVMEHLQSCNSCREVLDNMKRPIIVEREPEKEINYLGKIRTKIKRSYRISIVAVAILALTIAALLIKNSIIGDLSSFTDISINWSYSEETDSIILNGELLNGMAVSRVQVSPVKGNASLVQVNVYGVTPFIYTNKTFSVSIPWQDDIRIELRESNSQQQKIMDSWDLYPTINLIQGDLWVKGGMLADKYALKNIKSILFDTTELEIAFYKHLETFYQGSKTNALPNVPEYIEIIYSTSSTDYSLDNGLFLGVTIYVYEYDGAYFVKMADQIKEISVDEYNTLIRYGYRY